MALATPRETMASEYVMIQFLLPCFPLPLPPLQTEPRWEPLEAGHNECWETAVLVEEGQATLH